MSKKREKLPKTKAIKIKYPKRYVTTWIGHGLMPVKEKDNTRRGRRDRNA